MTILTSPSPADAGSSSAAPSPLLRVDGLNVTYATSSLPMPAVRDVSFVVNRGEVLGLVGESGSGKSTVLSALMRLQPRNAQVTARSVEFEGRNLLELPERDMRGLRGRSLGLVPQRPMTSLSPVTPVRRAAAPPDPGRRRRRAARRAAQQRRPGRAAHPAERLPVPVLRRPAAADAHRGRGAGPRAAAGPGRRAHHDAGRHGAGADPAAAGRSARAARQLRGLRQPRPRRRGADLRPRRRHVRRPARRAGPHRTAVLRPSAPLHAGPAGGDARQAQARRAAAPDPGLGQRRPASAGMPVRAAVSPRLGPVHHREPTRPRCSNGAVVRCHHPGDAL